MHVHLLHVPEPDEMAALRRLLAPGIRITHGAVDGTAEHRFQVLVAGRPDRRALAASLDLKTLIIPWAGLPRETRALMLERPHVDVYNLHHNADEVAEMAVALLLAAAKFVVYHDRSLRRYDWSPRYQPKRSLLLSGKKVLVLGYGAIGRRAAALCRGLNLEVEGIRRNLEAPLQVGLDLIHPAGALHSLLPKADVLLISAPLTAETEGLIGSGELAALPEQAVLVNVGRAGIVHEKALFEALKSGALYAAAIDVWNQYPADEAARINTRPSRFPFEELENVILSPHLSGMPGKAELERRRTVALAELLNDLAHGDEPPNRVDVEAGY